MSPLSPRPAASAALAALVLGGVLAGCSAASPTTAGVSSSAAAPASSASLATRSHSESGLVIYGNTPANAIQPLLNSFTKAYPWIKPQYSNLSDNQVFTKFESEHAQGARTADLLISDAIPDRKSTRLNSSHVD